LLSWRITLGALFISALVGLCWLDARATPPGIVLLPLAILLGLAGAGEMLAMFRHRGHAPFACVVYAGVLIVLVAAVVPVLRAAAQPTIHMAPFGFIAIGLIAALFLTLVAEMYRFREAGTATVNIALAFFAIAYVGGLLGCLELLRSQGMLALASMIVVVKSSDIGQYTAGRLIGKHKLAPRISPGKTWVGFVGGLVFACLGGWITFHVAPTSADRSLVQIAIYAITLAVAGILGDLAESLLKRDAGMKDSSTWMPGFGGVLDLLDSLLGAAPLAYLFWACHWIG
jgi:phosphatidate cytidylyltransferase